MARKRATRPGPYLLYLELLRERISDPNQFPYTLPAVRHLSTLEFHPQVTFLIGENGSGKSTLLEAIAVACGMNPEGGGVNFDFETRATHSPLDASIRLARTLGLPADQYFLRAESFYNVASEIELLDECEAANRIKQPKIIESYGHRSLHKQSHGESFFAVFKHRFRQHGLYLLDEPEAALSPARQLEFLTLLNDYVQRGSQFVIATHSPMIMAFPNARIYSLTTDGIRDLVYTDTDHYQITRRFMKDPARALRQLLNSDQPANELTDDTATETR